MFKFGHYTLQSGQLIFQNKQSKFSLVNKRTKLIPSKLKSILVSNSQFDCDCFKKYIYALLY